MIFLMSANIKKMSVRERRLRVPHLRFRTSRIGPETQLVGEFLGKTRFSSLRDCKITVFEEPCVGGAFPDVVIVAWKPSVAESWNPARKNIGLQDLRLAHYLVAGGCRTDDELKQLFGSRRHGALDRLEHAGLILKTKTSWRAKPLSRIFATVSIIAIEAKIHDWRRAVQQATLNTWFASQSYILLPPEKITKRVTTAAERNGIGVLKSGTLMPVPRTLMIPRSYVSWQLNEWAWQSFL